MSEPPTATSTSGDRRRGDVREQELVLGIIDAAPDGIVMVDDAGTIVLANRRAEQLFGYPHGELLGCALDVLLPERLRPVHEAHCTRYRRDPRTRPMGVGLELLGRRRDATEFPVEISLSPFGAGDGASVIAVVRDVGERLEAERRLRDAEESVRLLEDRERIARDLHDLVIQRLFASGMALQGVIARVGDADVGARVTQVVDDLDDTIRQLRTVIFALQTREGSSGLRARVLEVIAGERDALGFDPMVSFDGAVDVAGAAIAEQLIPTLREALSNVARHAGATEGRVRLTADPDTVTLRVVDNGVGPTDAAVGTTGLPGRGNGLRNARARAAALHGTCTLARRAGGGTVFEWRVPTTG